MVRVRGFGAIPSRVASHRTSATADEAADLPGDEIIPQPTTIWNRGITIEATPSEIWPWLVQMGYGRAGFYVPEWVDRLFWRVPAANSSMVLPQFQHVGVGDVIADGPGFMAYWRVKIVDPGQALVYWTRRHPWRGVPVDPTDAAALQKREDSLEAGGTYAECSWGFYLSPQGPHRTRLLIRTRAVSSPAWLRRMPYGLVDAYLSHAELKNIKRRVEQTGGPASFTPAPGQAGTLMNAEQPSPGGPRTLRVAAIQTPAAESVRAGLEHAAPWVEQAAAQGAQLVLLPELMATHYLFTSEMWDSAEPAQGQTVQWLRHNARRFGIWLGTSYLEASGEDFFNTFVLASPDGGEAGRVRKQTPAMYEPCFFRGEPGPHVISTDMGRIGVGVCNDNHRSYLPSLLQRGGADLVLMPHCWPLPVRPKGVVSDRNLRRWHQIQTGLAPLYARLLGVPVVFVNKVGFYASPAPVRWLPAATGMAFPGHGTIADSDGSIVAQASNEEGVISATVTLDPSRKRTAKPGTFGRFVYPAGPAGALTLLPAWLFGRVYAHSKERRQRAHTISAGSHS
ncbi:putative amidohydrolase [Pseudarthrobacter defluvii]|nr:putative amidohydrolase [Pseudarthrobacter defluvii]